MSCLPHLDGLYRLPNFLSKGGRELIPEMLMNDPVKRITIPEIRKEPWFQIGCPSYLAIPWEEYERKNLLSNNNLAFTTTNVNSLGFFESVMQECFNGLSRAYVIQAITSDQTSAVGQDAVFDA